MSNKKHRNKPTDLSIARAIVAASDTPWFEIVGVTEQAFESPRFKELMNTLQGRQKRILQVKGSRTLPIDKVVLYGTVFDGFIEMNPEDVKLTYFRKDNEGRYEQSKSEVFAL